MTTDQLQVAKELTLATIEKMKFPRADVDNYNQAVAEEVSKVFTTIFKAVKEVSEIKF